MKTTRQPVPTLIFDGECPFCRKWAKRLQEALHDRQLTFRSLTEESVLSDFPGISQESLIKSIHFIATDGTVMTGVDAIVAALSLRGFGKASKLLLLPGLHAASQFAYRTVAARRFRAEHKKENCGGRNCTVNEEG